MYNTEKQRDAWDDAGDTGSGIIGAHLRCTKGVWWLDDEQIDPKEGFKMCVIMPSTRVGQLKFKEGKVVDRDIGLIQEGFATHTVKTAMNGDASMP